MYICSCSFSFIAVFFNISCAPIIICTIVINFYFLYIMGWNKVLLLLLLLLLVSGPTVIGHSCCSVPSLPMFFLFVCLFVFLAKLIKKRKETLRISEPENLISSVLGTKFRTEEYVSHSRKYMYSRLSLNGHLYKADTSVKRTPRVGPCLSFLPLFIKTFIFFCNLTVLLQSMIQFFNIGIYVEFWIIFVEKGWAM